MWKMFQGAPRASATASEIQQAARKYRYSLRHAEDAVRHFSIRSGFEQRLGRLSAGKVGGRTSDEYTTISDWDCRELLSPAALGDPHGWALLDLEFPKLPDVPNPPEILAGTSESEPQQFEALARKVSVLKADAERAFAADVARASALRAACEANDPRAIETLAQLTLLRHPVPWVFSFEPLVEFDPSARVILATITVPDFVRANFCKGLDTNKPLSVLAKKKAQELCLHSLCLRAAFLLARGDAGNWWDTVAINAYQEWFDPATGSPRNGIIASSLPKAPDLKVLNDGSDDDDDESVTFSASRRCSPGSGLASPTSSRSVFPDLRRLAQMSRECRPCAALEQCDVVCRLIYLVF